MASSTGPGSAAQNGALKWKLLDNLYDGTEREVEEMKDWEPNKIRQELPLLQPGGLRDAFQQYIIPKLNQRENWDSFRFHLRHVLDANTQKQLDENPATANTLTDEEYRRVIGYVNKYQPVIVIVRTFDANSLGFHYGKRVARVSIDAKMKTKLNNTGLQVDDRRSGIVILSGVVFHEFGHFVMSSVRTENNYTGDGALTPKMDNFRTRDAAAESGYLIERNIFNGFIQPSKAQLTIDPETQTYPSWSPPEFWQINLNEPHSRIVWKTELKPQYLEALLNPITPKVTIEMIEVKDKLHRESIQRMYDKLSGEFEEMSINEGRITRHTTLPMRPGTPTGTGGGSSSGPAEGGTAAATVPSTGGRRARRDSRGGDSTTIAGKKRAQSRSPSDTEDPLATAPHTGTRTKTGKLPPKKHKGKSYLGSLKWLAATAFLVDLDTHEEYQIREADNSITSYTTLFGNGSDSGKTRSRSGSTSKGSGSKETPPSSPGAAKKSLKRSDSSKSTSSTSSTSNKHKSGKGTKDK